MTNSENARVTSKENPPVPHGLRYDVLGWICSVCGKWNGQPSWSCDHVFIQPSNETCEWRPIETAPRDGTDIIVGFDFATVWIVHVAWYRNEGEENGCEGPEDVGWWSYVRHSVTQEKLYGRHAPTHWIPLPVRDGDV